MVYIKDFSVYSEFRFLPELVWLTWWCQEQPLQEQLLQEQSSGH